MTDPEPPDPNVNIYRAQWSQEARDRWGYARETKTQTIERLSRSTSVAGIQEYERMAKKSHPLKRLNH